MSEKKNLDRLFQEKFKDFEVTPPEFVWENIQEALQEKKKRRIIPLWMRLSGVAAVLVIGSLLSIPYFSSIDTNENPVVIDKNGQKRIYPTDKPVPNHGTVVGDKDNVAGDANGAVASGNENADASSTNDINNNTGSPKTNGTSGNVSVDSRKNAVAHDGTHITTDKNKNGGKRIKRSKANPINEAVAYDPVNRIDKRGKSNTGSNNEKDMQGGQLLPKGDTNPIAQREDKDVPQQRNKANEPNGELQQNNIINKNLPIEQAVAEVPADTVAEPENELEKLRRALADKGNAEKAIAEESNKGKWNVKPQVAPVFYSSLSDGSPIDAQFASNSKSFDNDLSIGVGINYALTDRLSIRSGVNTVNLSYATNDVQFSPSLSRETNNVSARAKSANIVVTTADNNENNNPIPANLSISNQSFNGSMIQRTGYIEVPVEMSYALLNRKFGIEVIGGVSTLFLNENNVSVVSNQGYSTEVGQAQNLNNIHFSTNVGIGFKYRFWKQFQANFEPTFKYQVNAYSRDAGNFKPYFIGLYSGISFSF